MGFIVQFAPSQSLPLMREVARRQARRRERSDYPSVKNAVLRRF